MTREELLMEVAKLRLRLRMNNRLRLESQAVLSRLFREHGVPIQDELLSELILAVPDELLAEDETITPLASGRSKTPPPRPPTHRKPPPRPPTKRAGRPRRTKSPPPKPPTQG